MEDFILWLQSLNPFLIYIAVFAIAFIENVFPPSPSDIIIVFAGSLIPIGHVGFLESLLAATAGSTLGFVVMYKIGQWFGGHILEQGKIKFIPVEAVRKVETWFQGYGYWIIVANRFLAGTRAVVSFFAGMSELHLLKTAVLSFLSALAWNTILISGGYALGTNWQKIGLYLSTYSQIVTAVLVVTLFVWIIYSVYNKKNGKKPA